MVVCVSPATGSFMGWRVEKIDVAYPFQALTTRFVLKLPWLVFCLDVTNYDINIITLADGSRIFLLPLVEAQQGRQGCHFRKIIFDGPHLHYISHNVSRFYNISSFEIV